MEWTLLIISGLIAILGLGTKYKYISAVLFVEFLAMTGYQEIMLDPAVEWFPIEETAYFFTVKSSIQALLFMLYLKLDDNQLFIRYKVIRPAFILAGLSLIIIGYLWYTASLALYGVENVNYEQTMTFISITQLLIGLTGVLHGYRHLLSNIFHPSDYRNHTRT
jgi:hypothetical protein